MMLRMWHVSSLMLARKLHGARSYGKFEVGSATQAFERSWSAISAACRTIALQADLN